MREEASERADKISIQGVQPKLSARLSVKKQIFELVDQKGRFIIKPQHPDFQTLPENEDLTMKFASLSGIRVPDHGLVPTDDGQFAYWIRRFDRVGRKGKVPMEDFAQLLEKSRDTKYRSSLEKVAEALQKFATFPRLEAPRLLRSILFCFLCGNEDQHLKNFSLLKESDKVVLSPAYDLLSTTLALRNPREEFALPLRGKKNKLESRDFFDYFASERLGLREPIVEGVCKDLAVGLARWPDLLSRSFLSADSRRRYAELVSARANRLGFRCFQLDLETSRLLDRESLVRGSGGHQSLFKQIRLQQFQNWLCLTPKQVALVEERQEGKGAWQATYQCLARASLLS